MRPHTDYQYGQVYRRARDGVVVMILGIAPGDMPTDEMPLAKGYLVGFTIDRGAMTPSEYWPLFGTCNANLLDDDAEWELVE